VADVRAGGAQGVVDAEQVDGDRALEHGGIAVDERQLGRDAGVRDDDVEAAERAGDRGDRCIDLDAVGHVAAAPWRAAAAGGDFGEPVLLEADQRDARTAGVQALGERGADPARRAGDEDAAALQRWLLGHAASLPAGTGGAPSGSQRLRRRAAARPSGARGQCAPPSRIARTVATVSASAAGLSSR
jgi:hypothetical protein